MRPLAQALHQVGTLKRKLLEIVFGTDNDDDCLTGLLLNMLASDKSEG